MTNKLELLTMNNIVAAKKACEVAQVVLLTYKGGHRIAKGEALLRHIANGDEAREVAIAKIPVRDLDEAHLIEAVLARIAA